MSESDAASYSAALMEHIMKEPKVTYTNIVGLKEQMHIVDRDFIEQIVRINIEQGHFEPKKGMLLDGNKPGIGKRYFAEAIASELGTRLEKKVSFFPIISWKKINPHIPNTKKRIIELFKLCDKQAPSVLYLDDLEFLCPSRNTVTAENKEYYNSIIKCFLNELEEVDPSKVITIAATNRFKALDSAIIGVGTEMHNSFEPVTENEQGNNFEDLETLQDTPVDLKRLVNQVFKICCKLPNNSCIGKKEWDLILNEQASSRFSYCCNPIQVASLLIEHIRQKLNEINDHKDSQLDHTLDSITHWPVKKIFVEGDRKLLNDLAIGFDSESSPESLSLVKIDFNDTADDHIVKTLLQTAKSNLKLIFALFNIESCSVEQIKNIKKIAEVPKYKRIIIATMSVTEKSINEMPNVRIFFRNLKLFSSQTLEYVENFDDDGGIYDYEDEE